MSALGLSPEWDRWFDEEFTDLVVTDPDWVRTEFATLIDQSFSSTTASREAPSAASRGAPSVASREALSSEGRIDESDTP